MDSDVNFIMVKGENDLIAFCDKIEDEPFCHEKLPKKNQGESFYTTLNSSKVWSAHVKALDHPSKAKLLPQST